MSKYQLEIKLEDSKLRSLANEEIELYKTKQKLREEEEKRSVFDEDLDLSGLIYND